MAVILLILLVVFFIVDFCLHLHYNRLEDIGVDLHLAQKTRYWNDLKHIVITDDHTHADLVKYVTTEVYNAKSESIEGFKALVLTAKSQKDLMDQLNQQQADIKNSFKLFIKKESKKDDKEGSN